MLDDRFDRKGPGEEARRHVALARLQGIADAAGRDHAARIGDWTNCRCGDAMRSAQIAQHIGIAAARLAKGEILASDHTRNTQPFGQQFDHEILRRGRGELCIEIEHQHRIGTRPGKQPLPLLKRGQPEPGDMWREKAHRVRIEGGDDRRLARSLGLPDGFARHGLMAKVEAIEIAQRDDSAAQCLGHGIAGG